MKWSDTKNIVASDKKSIKLACCAGKCFCVHLCKNVHFVFLGKLNIKNYFQKIYIGPFHKYMYISYTPFTMLSFLMAIWSSPSKNLSWARKILLNLQKLINVLQGKKRNEQFNFLSPSHIRSNRSLI